MSMHPSGKILLVLYANNVLRLWNMMDARCLFKRKMGIVEEKESEEESVHDGLHEQGEDELEELELKVSDLTEV